MPGAPPVTAKFSLPRYSDADDLSFSAQVNSVSDAIDAEALKTGDDESLASLHLTGVGTALTVDHDATVAGQLHITGAGSSSGLVVGGDATLYRDAANSLRTGGALTVDGNATVSGNLTVVGTVTFDSAVVLPAMAGTAISTDQTAGNKILANKLLAGDANANFYVLGDGSHHWGPGGGTATDTNLYRTGAGALATDGTLAVGGAITSTGLVTGKAGLTLDAGAGTVAQAIQLVGRNAGAANTAVLAASSTGGLVYNVPGGQTHIFEVNVTAAATITSTAFNLAAGSKYQIGGTQIAASDLSNGTTGTAGGLLVLAGSPTLTGTPRAPTPAGGTNTTQIATTAYVVSALGSYAPLASPAFTGAPTANTAAPGTNTTQLATTAFVQAAVSGSGAPTFAGLTVTGAALLEDGLTLDAGAGTVAQTITLTGRHTGIASTVTLSVDALGGLTLTGVAGSTVGMHIGANGLTLNDGNGTATLSYPLSITGSSPSATLRHDLLLDVGLGSGGGQTITLMGRVTNTSASAGTIAVDPAGNLTYTATSHTFVGGLSWGGAAVNATTGGGAQVVLSASPTLSGTIAGALTFSNNIIFNGATASVTANGSGAQAILATQTGEFHALRVNVTTASYGHAGVMSQVVNGGGTGYHLFEGMAGTTLATKFYVDGLGNVWSNTNSYTSDLKLKEDVQDLDGSLAIIQKLRPRRFKWKKHPATVGKAGRIDYGLVAQEVEEVLDHLVHEGHVRSGNKREKVSKFKTLNYTGLVPFLVGAVQELAARVGELEAAAV